ncbi:MAG TPA: mandelate racemase/muconate lactonizing enzyme family protein [Candidatus Acidoferrales bacterium]|jgi:L-alanine-DL-glutamate epimerase-like enolase superfamily enzyme|nr:mandelate racemase/muconate lactonizing enzyme family protein [Candidatus Acidoferrales bacterium]
MTSRVTSRGLSRRALLGALFGAGGTAPFLGCYAKLQAAERNQIKIRDIRTLTLQGPSRTYLLVKVIADDGTYGVAEAYGTPGIGVKEQILAIKPSLVGKDPLQIDALYTNLDEHAKDLSGTRTDGSAHNLMRAASGIEMALWDLAGKALGVPTSTLLGGRFRQKVRVYDHSAPRNMLDKASCREWAQKVKADPAGFTAHKFGFPHTRSTQGGSTERGSTEGGPNEDRGRDTANRLLTTKELIQIRQGFENCREAIGWDHDIMVHCHWEYDLRTAIQIAEAVEPIKPLWLEDPLQVEYSEAWTRLCQSARVPICTGENLARRQGFKDFMVHQGCDILHPDLRNSGGFLETKRIADMADAFGLPMANHNTGSQLHTWATCQWAASIRDYMTCETITGMGDWMDKLLLLDGAYIKDGFVQVTGKPGLGAEVNPDVAKAHMAAGEVWWG